MGMELMATKLFETNDRNASHQELERVLAAGQYPNAECRDLENPTRYEVWSDREPRPEPAVAQPVLGSDMSLEKLAELVAEKLRVK